jgi:CelD/BcsL family acetyltransferase involved in cellulose biosynthesis
MIKIGRSTAGFPTLAKHRNNQPVSPGATDQQTKEHLRSRGVLTLHNRNAGSARRVGSLAELDDIQAVWDSYHLTAEWASPMQHHVWARTYAETYDMDHRLEVTIAGTGHARAIAPLLRPRGLGRRLELIGVKELYEVMDFLYLDSSDIGALATAVASTRLPIVLGRVRDASPALAALKKAYHGKAIVFCRPTLGCPWIALDDSWVEPEQHVNSGRRSDLRRARRNAKKIGAVTSEILSPTREELPSLLDEVYRVEAAGWKGRNKTAMLHDRPLGEFYRRYALRAIDRGMLRLCFLRIGGEAAAVQLAVVTGGRFWLFKIGYSEKYARCSPGVLLMLETIRYAAQAGLKSYEFLGAVEPWIRNWTTLEHPCTSFRAYPLNFRGVTAFATDAMAALITRTRTDD